LEGAEINLGGGLNAIVSPQYVGIFVIFPYFEKLYPPPAYTTTPIHSSFYFAIDQYNYECGHP